MDRERDEDSVIYRDGAATRRLRGRIIAEDDYFITVERFDGTVKIALSTVERIERRGGNAV